MEVGYPPNRPWQLGESPASVRPSLRLTATGAQLAQHPPGQSLNAVHTTRFTVLTWLPKSLWNQFKRVANVYFVLIAVLACTPLWGGKWTSKVVMVCGILLAQAFKDLYEDQRRRRDDSKENSRLLWRYDFASGEFAKASWQDCRVGDLVLICRGESLPADLLVVASSEERGLLYVSTKSLDGETNLKQRQIPPLVQQQATPGSGCEVPATAAAASVRHLLRTPLEVHLEAPHASLLSMDCSICIGGVASGVGVDNFAPRGCELQNTPWVVGVACYVGKDTKVRLNSFPAPAKNSELEAFLNRVVLIVLACIFAICLYFAMASELWDMEGRDPLPFLEVYVRYLIVLYTVLPMTMYIMFELMRLTIGRQIDADALMYDPGTDAHALARNTSVVEELGQVDFLFSDKTGTLTANEMRFAYCCVGTSIFGPFLPAEDGSEPQAWGHAHHQLADEGQWGCAENGMQSFFYLLAVCNTVQVDDDGNYQGESPDEVALVSAAKVVGIELTSRRARGAGSVAKVRQATGEEKYHFIAHLLAFTSDRKRMSVVCPTEAGGAVVLTKGADSVMSSLLSEPLAPAALNALAHFSRQGLRTLVVARRNMSPAEYGNWSADWDAANAAMQGRAEKIAGVAAAAERGLVYVGVTALEDRLQDGVPDTIATLRLAGIRPWVLTGDKVETAVEIAKSCRLFEGDMELVHVVGASSARECQAQLNPKGCDTSAVSMKRGIVLDGQSVQHIIQDSRSQQMLYQLATRSSSCVCCRLSPLQKRELVELVRAQNPKAITLSIGDGANDVPMIQGAHIGVGIRGKEGSAAVQASDMAVSQFRFLGNLLFCHGRRSYRRLALFLCLFVYKSVAIGWSYVINAQATIFSGALAYPEWLDAAYNGVTSLAAALLLCIDEDVPDVVALCSPELYSPGPSRACFNSRVVFVWLSLASVQGMAAWSVPVYVLASHEDAELQTEEFWKASLLAFTLVVFVVHVTLAMATRRTMTSLGLVFILLELLSYVVTMFALGSSDLGRRLAPELHGVPEKLFSSWEHVLCLVLFLVACAVHMLAHVWIFAPCLGEDRDCRTKRMKCGTSVTASQDVAQRVFPELAATTLGKSRAGLELA